MADDSEPPRKFYDLKPREFERVNPPRAPAPEPPAGLRSDRDPMAANPAVPADGGPIEVRDLFRQAQTPGPLLTPGGKPAGPENEVHAILRENHAHADAAGLFAVSTAPRRPSRRKRDYWVLASIASIFFGTVAVTGFFQASPVPFVYGIAGFVIVNIGLWWVMWQIMEDY
jgi:hypothetical protein